jgi:hypothetical protein
VELVDFAKKSTLMLHLIDQLTLNQPILCHLPPMLLRECT